MLSFLHTAESNVVTVGALMDELAPDIPVRQLLATELLAGDVAGYNAMIVDRLTAEKGTADVIVLAQASMAGAAAEAERRLGVPVLTSPRLGVAAAIDAWRRTRS